MLNPATFHDTIKVNKRLTLYVQAAAPTPLERMKVLAKAIEDARLDLEKSPSYNHARNLQKLINERKQLCAELRGNVKVAYRFEDNLVDEIVRKFG
jgi:hypothetical protein